MRPDVDESAPVEATLEIRVRRGVIRRFWPEIVLLVGIGLVAGTTILASYLSDKIVLLGSVDLGEVMVFMAAFSVWCFAAFFIGRVGMSLGSGGKIAQFVAVVFTGVVLLAAIPISVAAGFITTVETRPTSAVRLEVPSSSSEYLVATFVFSENSLTLYRGNGRVFRRTAVRMPHPASSTGFAQNHRIETDSQGRLCVVYPQEDGGEARVLLPQD